ncbi:MAG TPA: hypothetical protein VF719_00525, partial [Abditibacteriaceae bacterium]
MASASYSPQSAGAPESTTEFPTSASRASAQQLERNLRVLAQRGNRQRLLHALVRSLAVGVALCAWLLLLHRLYLADVSPLVFATILLASAIIGYRNGTLRRNTIFDAAQDAERALGLEERLSSAVAFSFPHEVRREKHEQSGGREKYSRFSPGRLRAFLFPRLAWRTLSDSSPTALVPALVDDAARRSENLDAQTIYPFRFGRAAKVLIVATFVVAILAFMPNIELFRTPEQRTLAGVLQNKGKDLEALAKTVEKKTVEQEAPETKALAKRMRDLGLKMQRGRMNKKEALISIGQLRKDLEKAQTGEQSSGGVANLEQVEQGLAQQAMQSAEGQKLQQEMQKKEYEKAARALEELANKMEKGQLSRDERDKAANDLEKAAKAMREAGQGENEQAAKSLEDAAKALRE